jgi:spore maturation protein CgeB
VSRNLRIAYFAHSVRSDWNNGNAHFLRGLLRSLGELGHDVTIFELADGWSYLNLLNEPAGTAALSQFASTYSTLRIIPYTLSTDGECELQRNSLSDRDVVIVHEWNSPELVHRLFAYREVLGFRLLFHDTHHRASSSPEQIRLFGIDRFDGVVAFGEALRRIYRDSFGIARVLTLHEAADTEVFHPLASAQKTDDLVWIGNWGDGERSAEIREFLLQPAAGLHAARCSIYGVRYPETGLEALRQARAAYRGYLPNLQAPQVYANARLTVHIPRQQYAGAMAGIPTIRVFEALACGIPLLSAPWSDEECLFRKGDFCMVENGADMQACMAAMLSSPSRAEEQAQRGLETVRARHTCRHRAQELTEFCEDLCT